MENLSSEVGDRISRVVLSSSNLVRTLDFYNKVLEMRTIENNLVYADSECKLHFEPLAEGVSMDRGQAFGRIAFACPTEQLKPIEATASKSTYGETVQTPFVTLPTPGKADVNVVILADPVSSLHTFKHVPVLTYIFTNHGWIE